MLAQGESGNHDPQGGEYDQNVPHCFLFQSLIADC
jgi:hypothetical protein